MRLENLTREISLAIDFGRKWLSLSFKDQPLLEDEDACQATIEFHQRALMEMRSILVRWGYGNKEDQDFLNQYVALNKTKMQALVSRLFKEKTNGQYKENGIAGTLPSFAEIINGTDPIVMSNIKDIDGLG
jgi:hypothetical protein